LHKQRAAISAAESKYVRGGASRLYKKLEKHILRKAYSMTQTFAKGKQTYTSHYISPV